MTARENSTRGGPSARVVWTVTQAFMCAWTLALVVPVAATTCWLVLVMVNGVPGWPAAAAALPLGYLAAVASTVFNAARPRCGSLWLQIQATVEPRPRWAKLLGFSTRTGHAVVQLIPSNEDHAWIASMFAASPRRRGLGKRLGDELIAWANAGQATVRCEAMPCLVRSYESHGFERTGRAWNRLTVRMEYPASARAPGAIPTTDAMPSDEVIEL